MKYIVWKDYKAVTANLKRIYQSSTQEEAEKELDRFAKIWDEKYPQISQSWRNHWPSLITFFDYPEDIRKAIYTTNAIESLNSAIQAASKKWTMPIHNWKLAMNRFIIEQVAPYL